MGHHNNTWNQGGGPCIWDIPNCNSNAYTQSLLIHSSLTLSSAPLGARYACREIYPTDEEDLRLILNGSFFVGIKFKQSQSHTSSAVSNGGAQVKV